MSFARLAFSSDGVQPLSSLAPGATATIAAVVAHSTDRAERLLLLGVTPRAPVTVLQTFPAFIFLCDQTELAVEREIADLILVKAAEG